MSAPLIAPLRQMIAALQAERQALAAMDIDALLATTAEKQGLCDRLEAANDEERTPLAALDDEARALLEAARDLNEINRQMRNLLARNVAARLDALGGTGATYSMKAGAGRLARTV